MFQIRLNNSIVAVFYSHNGPTLEAFDKRARGRLLPLPFGFDVGFGEGFDERAHEPFSIPPRNSEGRFTIGRATANHSIGVEVDQFASRGDNTSAIGSDMLAPRLVFMMP